MARLLIVCLAVLVMAAGGCSGDSGPQIDFVPLKGTVLIDGQPMTGGTLSFIPAPGTKGPVSTTQINLQGEFEVKGEGVPVGTHKVVVTCPQVVPAGSSSTGEAPPEVAKPAPCLVPAKYSQADKSDLILAAKKEQPTVTLELKSK